MKILPLDLNKYQVQQQTIKNKCCIDKNTEIKKSSIITDTISFKQKIQPDANLKKLLQYKIPDIYSEITLLEPQVLENALKSKIFSGPITSIVKYLQIHQSSLFSVEKQVLAILKNAAKNQPKKSLEQIIHEQFPKHNKILMAEQKPVFDKLRELSKEMPAELKEEFDSLMKLYTSKMLHKSIVLPFSITEFRYKLGRIAESLKSRNIKSECKTIKTLIRMVDNFIEPNDINKITVDNEINSVSKKRNRKNKLPRNITTHNADVLRQMAKVLSNSTLKDDRELNNLFIMAKAKIYKIPMQHPFKRKSFIYDLQKITSKLEDKKLANQMNKTAVELPTSKDSLSAFIVNEALNSSEKIGYDLLAGSIGTTEHIFATERGGGYELNNMALASAYKNNKKAHTDLAVLMRKEPEIYDYCQRHITRLIELCNNGIFEKIGLAKGYILNLRDRLENLSPQEKPLKLDISTLK